MVLRILSAGVISTALLTAGGCRSQSNYCSPRPVCATPGGCPVPVAAAPAPCCNGAPVGQVPPPPLP